MKKYVAIAKNVQLELESLRLQQLDAGKLSEKGIVIVSKGLEKLRSNVTRNGFSSTEDEIHFFKKVKPSLTANLIYFKCIYDIELKRSFHSENDTNNFIDTTMCAFKKVFNENEEFLRYFHSENTSMDAIYFKRSVDSFPLFNSNCLLQEDPNFATSKDFVLANILAFKQLQKHLNEEKEPYRNASNIVFTGTKYDFIELIYALHSTQILNKGEISIIDVSRVFEEMLNFQIGDIYKIFNEARSRKNSKTKFVEKMLNSLRLKMNVLDN